MKPTVRHRTAALSVIAAVVMCTFSVPSVGRAASSQERDEAQDQELISLGTIIAAALTGQIVPSVEPFDWENDTLKAYDQQTFVPFTLSIDQSKVSTSVVAMYVFVAAKAARRRGRPRFPRRFLRTRITSTSVHQRRPVSTRSVVAFRRRAATTTSMSR